MIGAQEIHSGKKLKAAKGFVQRRVRRPNPLARWDADTQAKIAADFDALVRELAQEHREQACREADNDYASAMDKRFHGDEAEGRKLLRDGFGPFSFWRGVFKLGRSRFAQFCLGHEVMHGSYATHPEEKFRGRKGWEMPVFILDKHWRYGHNRFHHLMPGVFGLDPESSPLNYRGSTDFYAELGDRITVPISSFVLAFMSLFSIGVVEAKKYAENHPDAWKELLQYNWKIAKREFVELPLQAGPKALRVLAGNLASFGVAEVISGALGRTTHVRNESICLHPNEFDPSNRAHFYLTSLLNAGNVDYPGDRRYIGGFDKHIEHHLFPFLSSRNLESASGRVKALCQTYGLPYREGSLGRILLGGLWLDLKLILTP